MEQVQFAVAQVLDSCTQVLRQHMSLRGRIGCWLCGRYRLYWRWRTVSDRLGREEVGRRLLTTIASHEGIVPPPTVGKQLRAEMLPRRARAVGGCRRGWPSGCGCRTGAVKCLSGAATPTGLIALSPCPVLIGFGTRDKRRYGCQPAPRRRVSSPGGAQGNPCIEQGVKGFNGPPRATPHGPTVFAHGFRMASKASSLVEAGLTGADLTGCRIYGVSA